eukprot:SAG22_NODE_1364_length_4611_cov_3.558732_1_plen_37_part_10
MSYDALFAQHRAAQAAAESAARAEDAARAAHAATAAR